jgi:SPP1 family predicted phage head-tail adaptor
MKDRITLTAPGNLDAWGQPTAGASVEVWAEIAAVKVADRAAGNAILAEATLTATIRWRDGITTAWTATVKGTVYNILAAGPPPDQPATVRQWIVLLLGKR